MIHSASCWRACCRVVPWRLCFSCFACLEYVLGHQSSKFAANLPDFKKRFVKIDCDVTTKPKYTEPLLIGGGLQGPVSTAGVTSNTQTFCILLWLKPGDFTHHANGKGLSDKPRGDKISRCFGFDNRYCFYHYVNQVIWGNSVIIAYHIVQTLVFPVINIASARRLIVDIFWIIM